MHLINDTQKTTVRTVVFCGPYSIVCFAVFSAGQFVERNAEDIRKLYAVIQRRDARPAFVIAYPLLGYSRFVRKFALRTAVYRPVIFQSFRKSFHENIIQEYSPERKPAAGAFGIIRAGR